MSLCSCEWHTKLASSSLPTPPTFDLCLLGFFKFHTLKAVCFSISMFVGKLPQSNFILSAFESSVLCEKRWDVTRFAKNVANSRTCVWIVGVLLLLWGI